MMNFMINLGFKISVFSKCFHHQNGNDSKFNICSRLINRKLSNDYSELVKEPQEDDDKLPKSIFFIIGNEFCERFSYYGLKTVLALYLTSELLLSEDAATSLYHGWSFLCYFTTLFGAVLADSFLGRYRTIFYLSIVYLIGNTVLSLAATKPVVSNLAGKTAISVIGLLFIAFGTGGIKPCVSAFGGDQFVLPRQQNQLSKFFSVFYFSINAGSLLSTLVTPILREDVTCFGGNCFPLAFGVPAILMIVALGLFLIGTPQYKIKPPEGNVLAEVIKCVTHAVYRNWSKSTSVSEGEKLSSSAASNELPRTLPSNGLSESSAANGLSESSAANGLSESSAANGLSQSSAANGLSKCSAANGLSKSSAASGLSKSSAAKEWPKRSHWLDSANEKFPSSLIKDIKILSHVLLLFLPLPFFWALFEQQGSRWTFQATKMSGKIGSWTIKPDQMQVLNPLLIMILIPCFEYIVYPGLSRWQLLSKPLHRMFVGGIFAAFAFIISGFLQLKIESFAPSNGNRVSVGVINALPCNAIVSLTSLKDSRVLPSHEMFVEFEGLEKTPISPSFANLNLSASVDQHNIINCLSNSKQNCSSKYIEIVGNQEIIVVINSYLGNLEVVNIPQKDSAPNNEYPIVRLLDTSDFMRLSYVGLRYENETIKISSDFFSKGVSASKMTNVKHGRYEVFLPSISGGEKETTLGFFTIEDEHASVVLLLYNLRQAGKIDRALTTMDANPAAVHMLWILPQYLIISIGEIMFSITGLQFSFTQAPESMKSVVQAAWLITVAFGNLIVVVIAETKLIKKQSLEFFCFAGLMFLDMLIFLFIVRRFYRETQEDNIYRKRSMIDSYESQTLSHVDYDSLTDQVKLYDSMAH